MQTKYSVDLTKDPFFKKLICGETYESKETLRLMIESYIKRKVKDVILMPNEQRSIQNTVRIQEWM